MIVLSRCRREGEDVTIFPCSRCGQVPELKPADRTDRRGRPGAMLVHVCRDGRTRKEGCWANTFEEAVDLAIYQFNEYHAGDNPAWWPERYDYLRRTCKAAREATK